MRLANKVAVIIGSSRSIGAAVAKRYAQVVVNYRSHSDLADQVVKEICSQGGEAIAIQADVSREEDVTRLVEKAAQRFGKIDILVNNAAMDPRKAWTDISVDEWDSIMGINVRSQFLCAKAVFPYMEAQGYGKIINVSSVTFFTGQKQFLHYVTSKGAIVGFTRALARELGGNNISVNCITPGAVLTETEYEKVSAETIRESGEYLAKAQCFSRREVAADIEGAFVFLASHDSDFITGQLLNVDGGWMMH